jgi:hypothetical protein
MDPESSNFLDFVWLGQIIKNEAARARWLAEEIEAQGQILILNSP